MPQLSIFQPSTTNSPKRKRHTQVDPFAPRLDTTPRPHAQDASPSGANSPRSAVAHQLEGLELRGSVPPLNFGVDAATKPAKIAKRPRKADGDRAGMAIAGFENVRLNAYEVMPVKHEVSQPRSPVLRSPSPRLSEIRETPQSPLLRHKPPASPLSGTPLLKLACRTPSPLSLPPAPDGALSNSASEDAPSPHSLTWQEEEITGHMVNPGDDPDDDGYGINGIGFRPTPSMAHARSQRRRQQLLEWKARETREARARRSQRRMRGASSVSGTDTNQHSKGRRVVRFA